MEIKIATKKYAKQISEMMLKDLENPPKEFSTMMIEKYIQHAQLESIEEEFNNLAMVGFVALEKDELLGFIVGYLEENVPVIHYIAANSLGIKQQLLDTVIKEAKEKNYKSVIADSFEFMENDKLFNANGFKLYKKEELSGNLILLWKKLDLNF